MRSGPSTGAGVVGELARRQTVTASATVRDGFRKLGDRGWVSAEYLRRVPGSSC
ncbi:MAG: SH3 domain-containing protein [Actinophytocola sp.]|nr:SH3 domain-containing protein [Actinophytocola sp.]